MADIGSKGQSEIMYNPNWLRYNDPISIKMETHLKDESVKKSIKQSVDTKNALIKDTRLPPSHHTREIFVDEETPAPPEDRPIPPKPKPRAILPNPDYTSALKPARLSKHRSTLLPQLRAGLGDRTIESSVIDSNSSLGVYSLVERGFIPAEADMAHAFKSNALRNCKSKLHPMSLKSERVLYPQAPDGVYRPALRFIKESIPPIKVKLFETEPSNEPYYSLPINPPPTPKESSKTIWAQKEKKRRFTHIKNESVFHPPPAWSIPFNNGHLFTESPLYKHFEKCIRENGSWMIINYILRKFANFLQRYAVLYADVDCKKLVLLSREPILWPLREEQIMECFVNSDEVYEQVNRPGQRFINPHFREDLAAKTIQSNYRKWKQRNLHLVSLEQLWAASIFQRRWRIRMKRRIIMENIKSQYITEDTKRCIRLMNNLKRDAVQIFRPGNKRVIIQVTNWRDDIHSPDFDFGRCLPLMDPGVSMIFIVPFINQTKINYFSRLLNLLFDDENPIKNNRIRFIVPEVGRFFKKNPNMSTTIATLASYNALNEIKKICTGIDSMIFCDFVSENDVRLSSALKIPIYGPLPEVFESISSRSKARKILDNAGLPLAPAVVSLATETNVLLANLVKAMLLDTNMPYLVFLPSTKMNMDYPRVQAPIAFIDVRRLSFKNDPALETFSKTTTAKQLQESKKTFKAPGKINPKIVEAELEMIQSMQFTQEAFNNDFKIFMESWKQSHGFIQACPCSDPQDMRSVELGFNLDWNGNFTLLATTEMLFDKQFKSCGFFTPQEIIPIEEIQIILKKVCIEASNLGFLGNMTVELLAWKGEAQPHYYATNLKPFLSTNIIKAQTILLATGCTFVSAENRMMFKRADLKIQVPHLSRAKFIDMKDTIHNFHETRISEIKPVEYRVAYYQDTMRHLGIEMMGTRAAGAYFIHQGFSLDSWTRKGIIFPTDEGLEKDSLPMISVGPDRQFALKTFLSKLVIMDSHLSSSKRIMSNNFVDITNRALYEYLVESKVDLKDLKESKEDDQTFDESKVTETDRLVSKFIKIERSEIRQLTPEEKDKDSKEEYMKMTPRMSGTSLLLLSEEIPSNVAAELDPTFKKPVLLPPFKRPKKLEKSKVSKVIMENELEEEQSNTIQSRTVSRESSVTERNIGYRPRTLSREASITDKNSLTKTSTPQKSMNESSTSIHANDG